MISYYSRCENPVFKAAELPAGIWWRSRWGHTAASWCCSSLNIAAPPRTTATAGSWRCGDPAWISSLPLPPFEFYRRPAELAVLQLLRNRKKTDISKEMRKDISWVTKWRIDLTHQDFWRIEHGPGLEEYHAHPLRLLKERWKKFRLKG